MLDDGPRATSRSATSFPAAPGCLVVITSRRRLVGPDERRDAEPRRTAPDEPPPCSTRIISPRGQAAPTTSRFGRTAVRLPAPGDRARREPGPASPRGEVGGNRRGAPGGQPAARQIRAGIEKITTAFGLFLPRLGGAAARVSRPRAPSGKELRPRMRRGPAHGEPARPKEFSTTCSTIASSPSRGTIATASMTHRVHTRRQLSVDEPAAEQQEVLRRIFELRPVQPLIEWIGLLYPERRRFTVVVTPAAAGSPRAQHRR